MMFINALVLWFVFGAAPAPAPETYHAMEEEELPGDSYRAMPGCGGYCW